MSILGIIGKVAKAGLGVVTHGVSDKVLSVLKGAGAAKKVVKQVANNQTQATVTKISGRAPTKEQAAATAAKGAKKKATVKRKAKRKVKAYQLPDITVSAKRPKKKAAKVKSTSTKKRVAPKGGLDLAAISRLWKAQGKPGSWQGFIKANPLKKK